MDVATALKGEERIKALDGLLAQVAKCGTAPDSLQIAAVQHALGVAWFRRDNHKAVEHALEAVRLREKLLPAPNQDVAQEYLNLGVFSKENGEYNKAIEYYKKSQPIFKALQDPRTFEPYFELAKIFKDIGDYSQALENVQLAEEHAGNTMNLGRVGITKGNVLWRMGNYDKAVLALQAALQNLEKNSNEPSAPRLLAACCVNLGNVYDDLGDVASSANMYRKSLTWSKDSGTESEISAHLNLGYIFTHSGQLDEAGKELALANDLATAYYEGEESFTTANVYANIGDLALAKNDPQSALGLYHGALLEFPMAFDEKDPSKNPSAEMLRLAPGKTELLVYLSDKAKACRELARNNNDSKYLAQALELYHLADGLVDAMRREQFGQQSKLFWRSKTHALYADALETCLLLNNPQEAFYFIEKSRAALLLDELRTLDARAFLPPAMEQKEQALKTKIRDIGLLLENADGEESVPLREQLAAAKDALEAFIKQLEHDYPQYYRLKYDDRCATLGEVHHSLSGKESFVEYFVNEDVLYVLAVTNNGPQFKKINFQGYGATVKEWLKLLSDEKIMFEKAGYDRFRELSHRFYKDLFAPFALAPGSVTITTDHLVLPFDAFLTDPTSPDAWLIKDYTFNYAYSATIWLRKNAMERSPSKAFIGFAPGNFAKYGLPELPGTEASLGRLATLFKGEGLTGAQAVVSAFKEKAFEYAILHFYTHAVASSGEEPKLFFYDTTLSINDLYALPKPLSARLAVLSACETGSGELVAGEGVLSLSRGFTAAGIESTVMTLWQVNANSTVELTELFYRFLQEGKTKAEALRAAKLEYLKLHEGDKSALPYYWAGMVHLGTDGGIDEKGGMPWWAIGMGGIVMVAGVAFWMKRKR